MKTKVTIQEIADFTGLSKFAVSRALSGKSGVSEQTRDLILRAAGRLGYFKDNPAAAPAESFSKSELPVIDDGAFGGTVVILFPNIRYQNPESIYWGPLFNGVTSRLNARGIHILTLTEPSVDQLFTLLNPQAIRGIITLGSISTSILLEIKRLRIPVVMVDHLDPAFHCDSIFTDNLAGMQEIMLYLLRKGFRSFQFVGDITDAHSYYERWLGFRFALDEHQVPHQQISELTGKSIGNQFHETFVRHVQPDKLPEVFVCANDFWARITIEALAGMGVAVPEHCFVTGFDNTYSEDPILATVHVDTEQLGVRAVDQMLWRISNPESCRERKMLHADVIVREDIASRR